MNVFKSCRENMNPKESGSNELLHLVGCPIQLTSRSKTIESTKRNRPRSAMCDHHSSSTSEVKSRPFSAGTLPKTPAIKSFLRTPANDSYQKESSSEDIFEDRKHQQSRSLLRAQSMLFEKNMSHGMTRRSLTPDSLSDRSEDTFVSLGTKIKAKAQVLDDPKISLWKGTKPRNYIYGCLDNNTQFEPIQYKKKCDVYTNSEKTVIENKLMNNIIDKVSTETFEEELLGGEVSDLYDQRINDIVRNSHDNLSGRVSFGASKQIHNPYFHTYDIPRYGAGNQLSLVEEESSEGSEISAKHKSPLQREGTFEMVANGNSNHPSIKSDNYTLNQSPKLSKSTNEVNLNISSSNYNNQSFGNQIEESEMIKSHALLSSPKQDECNILESKIENNFNSFSVFGVFKDGLDRNADEMRYIESMFNPHIQSNDHDNIINIEYSSSTAFTRKFPNNSKTNLPEEYKEDLNHIKSSGDTFNHAYFPNNVSLETLNTESAPKSFPTYSLVSYEGPSIKTVKSEVYSEENQHDTGQTVCNGVEYICKSPAKMIKSRISMPSSSAASPESKYRAVSNEEIMASNAHEVANNHTTVNNIDSNMVPSDYHTNEWIDASLTFRNEADKYEQSTNFDIKINENENNQDLHEVTDEAYYPTYLKENSSKEYTSQVIKDYEKEIATIDTLHQLTLEDLKNHKHSAARISSTLGLHTEGKDDALSVGQNQINENNFDLMVVEAEDSVPNTTRELEARQAKLEGMSGTTNEVIQDYLAVKSNSFECDKNRKVPKKKTTSKKHTKNNEATGKGANSLQPPSQIPKHRNTATKKNYNESVSRWQDSNYYNTYLHQVGKKISVKKNSKLNAQKIHLNPKDDIIGNKASYIEVDKDIDSWMSLRAMSPINESSTCDDTDKSPIVRAHSYMNIDIPLNRNVEFDAKSTARSTDNYKIIAPAVEALDVIREESIKKSVNYDLKPGGDSKKQIELEENASVFDVYKALKEIELQGGEPMGQECNIGNLMDGDPCQKPSANYSDIVSFLEKVEDSANEAITNVTKNHAAVTPKIEALMKLSTAELAHQIVTNSLQLEEKSCCIALLQETLAQSKTEACAKIASIEKYCRQSIYKAKQDCEEIVKRHQTFIDRLITDKKTLNHRIEQMVDERRTAEERWRHTTNASEEKHRILMKNQHDKLTAAHQLAKQRWVKQKADKIKELTVKGLEGELREMADKQQRELAALRISNAQREAALEDKYVQDMLKLKDCLARDKNEAIDHERKLCAERMEKQMSSIELTYQQQRMRLMAEMRAEGERTITEASEKEAQSRRNFDEWRKSEEQRIKERERAMLKEIDCKNEKMLQENTQLREKLEDSLDKYKSDYAIQQEQIIRKKELEIQSHYKQERDREIEKAIECMEQEAQQSRQDMQEFVVRTKEQYSMSLKELSETEKATLNRCQEAQARLRNALDNCSSLEITISQLDAKIRMSNEENSQLKDEIAKIKQEAVVRMNEEKEKLFFEIEVLKKSHNELMHQLYAKVKVAVARKDTALTTLEREHQRAKEKIIHLEQRLEQQRKDYFEAKR